MSEQADRDALVEVLCSIDGCDRPVRVIKRQLCNAHYQRWAKYGDAKMRFGGKRLALGMDPVARFWSKVEKTEGCWTWLGTMHPDGYGRFWAEGRQHWAHRWAYELEVGPIPSGLVIDHLCRNRACVNPEHLEPVTNIENVLRGESASARAARREKCIRGHRYDEENTYIDSRGVRSCRSCRRERDRAA